MLAKDVQLARRIDLKPKETSLLKLWLEARDISAFEFAKKIGVDPKTVLRLCYARCLPSYIIAYKIQEATQGGVPAESWLGTELGRMKYNLPSFDWDGWLVKKADATRESDRKRRAARRASQEGT